MYTKLDYRSGCKAKLQFSISSDGEWTVSKHIIDHNHAFCPIGQRHLLKSHRGVDREYLEFIMLMKESGTKVSDVHRMLQKQAGGVSALGFTKRDAYNVLETERSKTVDGTDSNTLIGILKKRAEVESDFFFDFELVDGVLSCFFWRYGQMKSDYERFGDLVVHDTTYRTNKYDMICAAIKSVFPGARHRLCTWHIDENSKKHIMHLARR
ncbi:unnamed protein product [Cuscuta epithymum]|uniref:Protein FAR1-RELATED SEQUENCE n=1 Tax=Cuscuta epithymum TaxID=186058 RepID=A0AAV0CYR5_9ASTE|nr:unnamed protein product [Cuscuta epithymum]